MSETSNFDFCPKCGALAKDGICQSCGYQNPDAALPSGGQEASGSREQPEQNPDINGSMQQGRPDMQAPYGQSPNVNGQLGQNPGINTNPNIQSQPGSQGPYVQGQGQPGSQGPYAQGSGQPGSQGPYAQGPGSQGPYVQGPAQPGNQGSYAQGPGSQGPYVQGQAQRQNQGMYGQQQTHAYQNYGSNNMYPNYMPAPAPVQKSSKAPLIIILVLAAMLLVFGIAFAVFYVCGNSENPFENYKWSIPGKSAASEEKPSKGEPETSASVPEASITEPESFIPGSGADRPEKDEEGLASGKYYTEIYSDIRDDLDYQVEMKYGDFVPEGYPYAYVNVSYPQIMGDMPNIDYLNEVLEYEYSYFVEYFEENLRDYMEEESYYYCFSEAFVTYMDEKVMSVVFREQVQLDTYGLINLYCVNINVEDGVIMNNTELLNIDKEFAIDFRNREILENGDELLTYYSDQEILNMLQDPDYLIIFYTPMGMEVGLNMMDVIIYVTYSDYERFISGF